MARPPRPRESEVLAQVLAWLRLHRVFHWRNNSGARVLPGRGGKGQLVRWGVVGSGDVFALLPGGRFVSVEVKRPGGKPRPSQVLWADAVRAAGGAALVVTGVEELERGLREEGWTP